MKARGTALYPSLLAAFLGLGLAGSQTSAQLVNREQAAPVEKKATSTLAEELARAVGEGLERPVTASEKTQGIPTALYLIFENAYQGESRERLVKRYADYARSFELRWGQIQQRQREVDTGIKKAQELAQARNLPAARDALIAVLTGTSVDGNGKIKERPGILEIMDAELPALYELAKLARDAQDPSILPDITAALRPRRRLLDASSEMLLWCSYQAALAAAKEEGSVLRSYGAGQVASIGRALGRIDDAVEYLLKKDGLLMAQGFFYSLKDYGLPRAEIWVKDSVKAGGFGLFHLFPPPGVMVKVADDGVFLKIDVVEQLAKDCHETDKVDGFDPVSRRFTYRRECKLEPHRLKASLKAALKSPPAAWAKGASRDVWLFGKVDKQGDDWVLSEAQVVDFRFLGAMSLINFGDNAARLF